MTPLHAAVIPSLMREEGFRPFPYRCTAGKLTIGFGTNLDEGLSEDEALFLLEHRVALAVADCRRVFPWFAALDRVRAGVVVQMRYQLGMPRLLGFKKFHAAMARADYVAAAAEMLDSKWARHDSPARAHRLAATLPQGDQVRLDLRGRDG